MLAKKISSLQHPLVIHWSDLVKKRAYREEKKAVIVSGEKLIRELAQKKMIKSLITLSEDQTILAEGRFLVTEGILQKITGLASPDGYAAEIEPPPPQLLSSCRYLLILDQIADPGNLGTLLRTAYAFGWEGVALTHGTADLFNDKALRAAKGATFHLPYQWVDPEEIASWGHHIFIADIRGNPVKKSPAPPIALVLSNEAKGPREWSRGEKVHIPMRPEAESLNVASAGAILLYEMRCP